MGQATYSIESVNSVVENLRAEAARLGRKPYHLADDRLEECRKNNDQDGVKFWRNIWIHLMTEEYNASKSTIILTQKHRMNCEKP